MSLIKQLSLASLISVCIGLEIESVKIEEEPVKVNAEQDTCHAIALAGGGAKGAYEAGVIWGLMHYGNPEDYKYDVVTGVSAGAINGAAMSVWDIGEEVAMSEYISDTWQQLTDRQIYENWWGGLVAGVTFHSSVYNADPLENFIRTNFEQFGSIKKKVVVSSVDVEQGGYIVHDEKTPWDDFPKAVRASAAIPGVFQPVDLDGRKLMDGGTTWNTNLASAIEKCLEIVDNDSKITVDIVLCEGSNLDQSEGDHCPISNMLRYDSIKEYYSGFSDVNVFYHAYPNVNFRHLFAPTGKMAGGLDMLNFDNATNTWPMQELGRSDAQAGLQLKNGEVFEALKDWQESQSLKKEHPSFMDYVKKLFPSIYN